MSARRLIFLQSWYTTITAPGAASALLRPKIFDSPFCARPKRAGNVYSEKLIFNALVCVSCGVNVYQNEVYIMSYVLGVGINHDRQVTI